MYWAGFQAGSRAESFSVPCPAVPGATCTISYLIRRFRRDRLAKKIRKPQGWWYALRGAVRAQRKFRCAFCFQADKLDLVIHGKPGRVGRSSDRQSVPRIKAQEEADW